MTHACPTRRSSDLITAHHLYYPVDAVPEFWEWLAHQGVAGQIKMPVETFEEVKDGGTDAERDMLYAWVQEDAHKSAILFDEDVGPEQIGRTTFRERVCHSG